LARKLGNSESAAVITFYQNLAFIIGAPMLAAIVSLGGLEDSGHPSLSFLLRPWLLMAACGVIATAGMTLLTQAYRIAPAGDVAVFEYSAIIWVPLWGLVFFDEIPKLSTVIGAALICGAGLFALRTSRRAAAYS